MEKLAMCIPSILPLLRILKISGGPEGSDTGKIPYTNIRLHEGIDFTGAPNSPVYATEMERRSYKI
jgi:murein DD-endopeptidase MepM/ murein hydrolase activator NlpD